MYTITITRPDGQSIHRNYSTEYFEEVSPEDIGFNLLDQFNQLTEEQDKF